MVLVSFMAPLAIISPLAGVFVDKWNVKWTMIASDLIRGVLVLALVFVHDLNAIYVILFMHGVGLGVLHSGAIGGGAHAAPAAGLMAVNALDVAGAVQGSQIVAPSVAGGLVQVDRRERLLPLRRAQFLLFGGDGDDADDRPRRRARTGSRACPPSWVDARGIPLHLHALDDFVRDSLDDGGDVRDALLRRAALGLRARRAAFDVRGVRLC